MKGASLCLINLIDWLVSKNEQPQHETVQVLRRFLVTLTKGNGSEELCQALKWQLRNCVKDISDETRLLRIQNLIVLNAYLKSIGGSNRKRKRGRHLSNDDITDEESPSKKLKRRKEEEGTLQGQTRSERCEEQLQLIVGGGSLLSRQPSEIGENQIMPVLREYSQKIKVELEIKECALVDGNWKALLQMRPYSRRRLNGIGFSQKKKTALRLAALELYEELRKLSSKCDGEFSKKLQRKETQKRTEECQENNKLQNSTKMVAIVDTCLRLIEWKATVSGFYHPDTHRLRIVFAILTTSKSFVEMTPFKAQLKGVDIGLTSEVVKEVRIQNLIALFVNEINAVHHRDYMMVLPSIQRTSECEARRNKLRKQEVVEQSQSVKQESTSRRATRRFSVKLEQSIELD